MKNLHSSLQHFVVQKGRLSNKAAVQAIAVGRVLVNGQKGFFQQELRPQDEVLLDGQVLQSPRAFLYIAYYKPRGVECTLNPSIKQNLLQALGLHERVFPVGRLDKESEGLLLLTDDGRLYNHISHAENHQAKEYHVTVHQPLTPETVAQLAAGVEIMGQKTRPAQVTQLSPTVLSIVLTQGLNRQIRRMCYKLGYEVLQLVRVRIVNLTLGQLQPGEWRYLSTLEVQDLLPTPSAEKVN